MPSTKTFAILFAGALAAAMLLGFVVQRLVDAGVTKAPGDFELPAKLIAFALFLVLGFSGLALLVKLFIAGQVRIGNGELALVRMLREHETGVILAFWGLCALGLAIAIPAALLDGAFGREAQQRIAAQLRGESRGTLVANIGMTMDQVRAQSSLPLAEPIHDRLVDNLTLVGDQPFDLQLAGTGMRFAGCRYYFITTGYRGDPRIATMSIGISPQSLTRAELVEAHRALQQALRADGWRAGRYVHRTEEELQLHGGQASSGEGYYWLKGETLLQVAGKRVDETQPGEDAATAGEWIQYLELRPAASDEDLEFDPS